jgi:signal transduction histidine kinase
MIQEAVIRWTRPALRSLDPRRSLGIKVGGLVTALSLTFSALGALWIGNMAKAGLLKQHCRQLALDAEQVSSALDQSLASRMQSLRAVAAILGANGEFDAPHELRAVLGELQSTSPELEWIGFADQRGALIASTDGAAERSSVVQQRWFSQGLKEPWVGRAEDSASTEVPATSSRNIESHLDFATPVRDSHSRMVGVVSAQLSWHWLEDYANQLREALRQQSAPEELVLDRQGEILIGPTAVRGKRWQASHIGDVPLFDGSPPQAGTGSSNDQQRPAVVNVERDNDGRVFLVSRVDPKAGSALANLGWTVQLIEPRDRADQRFGALWVRTLWVSLALGATAAVFGILITYRLTRRLTRLSRSVEAVGAGSAQQLEVPPGVDEVTRLGNAFSKLLGALQTERAELSALSADLERRVMARTREVERLARETRYAEVVRERLRIARDLHDTLAHSMMAMLAEVRLLKKLHVLDPTALPDELARAEQVAHEGLREARASISRMRFNSVRDVGLGAALTDALKLFGERTGLQVDLDLDQKAGAFAEERAETVFRIAEEVLRNVERHARASKVRVTLRGRNPDILELGIEDDGVGFDPDAMHAGHFGIVGMREQAQLIGAELNFRSIADRGTAVRLVFGTRPEN